MKRFLLFSISILLLGTTSMLGQKKFQVLEENSNVIVSYSWKPVKALKKEGEQKLVIKLENENNYPVTVSFSVDYYWDAILKSSGNELTYCLKKNTIFIGDIKKLGFDQSDFSNDQLLSDQFTLEIDELEIKEVQDCKNSK